MADETEISDSPIDFDADDATLYGGDGKSEGRILTRILGTRVYRSGDALPMMKFAHRTNSINRQRDVPIVRGHTELQ